MAEHKWTPFAEMLAQAIAAKKGISVEQEKEEAMKSIPPGCEDRLVVLTHFSEEELLEEGNGRAPDPV